MIFPKVTKYSGFVRIAAVLACEEKGDLLGRMAFFPLILGVLSSLWRAAAEVGMPTALAPGKMVWYAAATEWILLSTPLVNIDIEQQVRRGDIACELSRPGFYLAGAFAQGLGEICVRAPLFCATAFVCAWLLGGPPSQPWELLYVVPFGFFAIVTMLVFNIAIGVLAFWLQSTAPVSWVWSKAGFVFGGLMMPLTMYPSFIQRAAQLTPFPSLLYGPARFTLGAESGHAGRLAARLLFWLFAASLVTLGTYRAAIRRLTVNGG